MKNSVDVYLKMGTHKGEHYFPWGFKPVAQSLQRFVVSMEYILKNTDFESGTSFEVTKCTWLPGHESVCIRVSYDLDKVQLPKFPVTNKTAFVVHQISEFFHDEWKRRLDEYYDVFVDSERLRKTEYYPAITSVYVQFQAGQ